MFTIFPASKRFTGSPLQCESQPLYSQPTLQKSRIRCGKNKHTVRRIHDGPCILHGSRSCFQENGGKNKSRIKRPYRKRATSDQELKMTNDIESRQIRASTRRSTTLRVVNAVANCQQRDTTRVFFVVLFVA